MTAAITIVKPAATVKTKSTIVAVLTKMVKRTPTTTTTTKSSPLQNIKHLDHHLDYSGLSSIEGNKDEH